MFIFLLSLTGIPLTGGFMGKFFVFGAAVQHQYFWLAAIATVNAAIAAYYYLNVVRAMFFTTQTEAQKPLPISIPVQLSLFVCVVATFWIGIYPPKSSNGQTMRRASCWRLFSNATAPKLQL